MPESSAGAPKDLDRLRRYLAELGSVLVCYSGGIDSALVLAVAHEQLGEHAVGLTAVSPSLSPAERLGAIAVAEQIGAQHRLIETHELDRPGYAANGPDRCFHCKTELYEVAERERVRLGLAHLANGTNVDDLGDHRPGLDAAKLAGVESPLVDLGLGKTAVRALARELGLEIWAKPASACLSSRIPYGSRVTPERLSQIASLESALRDLGFGQVRVRWHDTIARIEVGADEITRLVEPELRASVVAAGKRAGFAYVTLDLLGYRVGSHNEVLSGRALRVVD